MGGRVEQNGTRGWLGGAESGEISYPRGVPCCMAANLTEEVSMAETTKAKAGAKPRKPTTTKKKAEITMVAKPSREEIERRARAYWAERGYQDGYAEQDWLRA